MNKLLLRIPFIALVAAAACATSSPGAEIGSENSTFIPTPSPNVTVSTTPTQPPPTDTNTTTTPPPTPPPAPPAPVLVTGAVFNLEENPNLCIGSSGANTALKLVSCADTNVLRGLFERGQLQTGSGSATQCVGINAPSAPGLPVSLGPCTSVQEQLWSYKQSALHAVSTTTDQCINANSTPAVGVNLQLEPCTATSLHFIMGEAGFELAVNGNYCLQAQNPNHGTPVVMAPCNDSNYQQWTWEHGQLRALDLNNQCLDLPGGSTTYPTALQIWDCNGLFPQQWILDGVDGSMRLASPDNYCLNLGPADANGHLPVETATCTAPQVWMTRTKTITLP